MNNRTVSITTTGVVTGLMSVFFAISYTSLIFNGDLVEFRPTAIAYFIQGALIIGLITALFSSLPGSIATVQDVPAAMYAVITATIVARMTGVSTPAEMFATVLAGLVMTAIIAGLGFWLLGTAKLGNLVSYIPYPVTAGFLAGVGLYLIVGAVQITAGMPVTWANAGNLIAPATAAHWLPAALFGGLLFLLTRRLRHPFVLPGFLVAVIVGFQIWVLIAGAPDGGSAWTLSGLPPGGLWQLPDPTFLTMVNWQVLFTQVGAIGSILVVSSLSMLMNVGGLDMNLVDDIDFNRELKITGWANLLLGLTGSSSGYASLSLSSFSARMHANSRFTGVALAVTCAVTLTLGGSLLHLVPLAAVGGLLFYLGLNFLGDWLFDSWGKLSKSEFAIVLLIFAAMQIFGALIGVGIGLMLSVALFVFTYSRFDIVRTARNGTQRHSNVERPLQAEQQLRQVGDHIYILELDGFIFFGAGNLLIQQIRERIEDKAHLPLQYLLLDFHRVSGVDASAVQTFVQIQKLSEQNTFTLVFTSMSSAVESRIKTALTNTANSSATIVLEDTDRGLEWCEEQLLKDAGDESCDWEPDNLWDQLRRHVDAEVGNENRLHEFIEIQEFGAGHTFIEHGVRPAGIYFIATGEVSVILNYDDGRTLRLRRAGPGAVFGEMSFYADTTASASLVTDMPTSAHFLSHAELQRMEQDAPALAAAFHKFVATILSVRLGGATTQLHLLQE